MENEKENEIVETEVVEETEQLDGQDSEVEFDEDFGMGLDGDGDPSRSDYFQDETVTVQSVEFPSFDTAAQAQGEVNKNLDLLMDVKLQLSVELGRSELPIKKVLELTRGSIVELDKVAGEPVELYANGKLVAHGEVVVIEDNFGLRITSIYESEDRLRNFQ